ncbi:MAG: D-alanyl-D-alanine carboxypeptidase [Alphaproteobacteria bacterium]|nr:D-alanyl-D-alanine carboxypeptidase [Alphaproteobacteria bacterium]
MSLFLISAPAFALETVAREAIILDAETGAVLFEKNPDTRMPPASMSKTMTIYMVFDALKNGRMKLDQTCPVSEKAWRMQGSKMFVELGNNIAVEDLIRGVVIQSGNDATVVLAECLAGTEEGLADAMNIKAKELGMTGSNFTNASGWPDPEHYTTVRDLATLARALINNFPDYYKYYSETEFEYHGIKQGNRNPLLYRNIGADGVKTGHTEEAGYGLIGSGIRDGRRVIMVATGMTSMQERADETAKLLDWGMRSFENLKLAENKPTLFKVPVVLGKVPEVSVTMNETKTLTLPKMSAQKVKFKAVYKEPVLAPIKLGDAIGELEVIVPDMPVQKFPLVAAENVERMGFFMRAVSTALGLGRK